MDGSMFSPVVELRNTFENLPEMLRRPIEMVVFGGELPRADISAMRRMAAELRARGSELDGHSNEIETLLAQEDSVGELADQLREALRSYGKGAARLSGDVGTLADQAQAAANDAEKWLCVMFTFGIHLAWRIFGVVSSSSAAGPAGTAAAAPTVDGMLVEGRAEVTAMRAGLERAVQAGAAKAAARLSAAGPLQLLTMVGKAAALPVGVDAGVQALQVATGDRTADIIGSDGSNPTGVDLKSIEVAALAGVGGAAGGMLAGRFAPMVFPRIASSRLAMGLVHGTAGAISGLGAASMVAGWPQHYDQVLAPLINGAFAGGVHSRGGAHSAVDGGGAFAAPDLRVRPPLEISPEARRAWEAAKDAWAGKTKAADTGGERSAMSTGDAANGKTTAAGAVQAPRPAESMISVSEKAGRRPPVSEVAARQATSGDAVRPATREAAARVEHSQHGKTVAAGKPAAPRSVEAVGETSRPPKISASSPPRAVVEVPEKAGQVPPSDAHPPADSGAGTKVGESGQEGLVGHRGAEVSGDGPETVAPGEHSPSAQENQGDGAPAADHDGPADGTGDPPAPPPSNRDKAVDLLIDFHASSGAHIPESLRLHNLSDEVVMAGLHDPDQQLSMIAGMEVIRRGTISAAVPDGMMLRVEQAEAVYALAERPVEMKPGEGKSLVFMAAAIQRAVHNESVLLVTTTDGLANREAVKYRKLLANFGIDVFRAGQQTGFGPIAEGRAAIVVATGETVGHLCNAGVKPPRTVLVDEGDGIIDRGERQFLRSEGVEHAAPRATADEVFGAHDFLADALVNGKLSHEDFGLARIAEEIGVHRDGAPEFMFWYDGQPELTPEGRAKVEALPGGRKWLEGMGASRLEMAAQAEFLVRESVHYEMDTGKIVIVDQAEHGLQRNKKTSSESRWSAEPGKASLAQAIEAKEIRASEARGESTDQHRIVVRADAESAKRIDAAKIYRAGGDFFDEVAIASGTLVDLNPVLSKVYGLGETHEVGRSSVHRLVEGEPDVVGSTHAKLTTVAEYAYEMRADGEGRFQQIQCHRNDLVARQVEALVRAGVPREAIEAVDAKRIIGWGADWEAQLQKVFDEAGEQGKILVINRQGQRGVDISVSEAVLAKGGMHVWMTEASEQSYIHEQAKNRTARNGDRGSAQVVMSTQDALIRSAMHLRGVREAVVQYEQAAATHTADPTPANHEALVAAERGIRELTPGLQQRVLRHSVADFIRHHALVDGNPAQTALNLAEADTGHYRSDLNRPDGPADRTTRLAGLLGIPVPALASHLAAIEHDGAIDPLRELLKQSGVPAVAAEAVLQHVETTAPARAVQQALFAHKDALDYLTPLRNRLAAGLGVPLAGLDGAEGMRSLDPALTDARDNLARMLGYPPSAITPAMARDILGEAVDDHLATTTPQQLATGDDFGSAAADSAPVDVDARNPAEDVLAAAAQYLATASLLDLVVQMHRRSPNSCVNNAVTGMRVLCPDNARSFQMPATTLQGHDRDVVRRAFGSGLEDAGSLDQVAESLKSRPGGITVLVYKWKDGSAEASGDADDHMVLLVNDSASIENPNLVVVDLAASGNGDTTGEYRPKDLRDRRTLLNKAVGFGDWRDKQKKFIDKVPEDKRRFETIEFDRDGNFAKYDPALVAAVNPPSPGPPVIDASSESGNSGLGITDPPQISTMVDRARLGDAEAFRELRERYGEQTFRRVLDLLAPGTAHPAGREAARMQIVAQHINTVVFRIAENQRWPVAAEKAGTWILGVAQLAIKAWSGLTAAQRRTIRDAVTAPLQDHTELQRGAFTAFVRSVQALVQDDLGPATGEADEAVSRALDHGLSNRELRLIRMVAAGLSNDTIASHLEQPPTRVKFHLAQIRDKLGAQGRIGILTAARELGLLSDDEISVSLVTRWNLVLTAREVSVLAKVAAGKSNKTAAAELGLSPLTVKAHLARIGGKLGISDRAGMVARAIHAGLIPAAEVTPGVEWLDAEREVLGSVAEGMSNKEIGVALGLSLEQVKGHLNRIGAKLGIRDRAGMVGKALGTSGFSLPPATANSGSGVLRRDDSLSETEAQVLSLVKQGRTNKQIAAALGIAPATVSAYLIRIGLKLRTSGRAEAVDAAETRGIDLTGDLLEDGSIGSRPSEGVGDAPSPGVREQYEVRGAGAAVGVSGRAGEQDRTEELAAERHRLEELLNVSFGWLDPDDVSVAILLMSELMANALADTDGRVEVVITQTDVEAERRLRFEVRDDSAFVPEIGDMPDEFAERGRGLSMMAIVADEFGTTSFDDGSGKSTWFELHRSLPPGGPVEPVTDAPSAQPTASSNELRASDSDPDGLIGRRPHDPEDADGSGPGTAHRAAPEGFRAALTTQLWGQASSIPADDSVRNHSRRERDMLAVLDHVAGVASGFVASALRQGLDATVVEAVRGLDPADLEAMLVDLGATRSAMIGVLSRFVQLQIHGAITRAAPETRPDVSGYLVPVSAPDGSDSWRTRRLVRRIMENWAGPGEVGWPDPSRIEDAVLLVSELAGNIPRHAHTSGFIIATVTDSPGAPVLRVGIRDYSRTLPKWRNADDDAESGRGGFLLKALATDYGVVQHPDGKTVWFEIRGEPPGTEPAGEQKAPPDQGPGSADEVATGSDFDAALKAAEAAFADIGEDSPPPSSGPEGLIGSAPHDPRETQFPTVVREAMNTGVVQRERLPGAPGVTVERVTFGNGYRSHRETYDNADDAARQWAISVIGGAMGATVAGTHPDADDRTVLYREIMPGRRANTVLPQGMSRLYDQGLVDDPASVAARAVLGPLDRSHLDSESGELLGLLDAVTGTRRSTRNWSIGEDGEVAGGRGAIESEKKDYGPSPFAAKFIRLIEGRTVWQDHPIRRSVITSMRERVAALSDRLAGFAPMQEDMLIAVHRQVLNELVRAERHAVHTPEEAAHFTGVSADAQAKARLAEEFALAHPYIVITGFDHPDVPVDAVREILETLDDLLTRHRYAPNLVAHLTNIRELGIEFLPSDDAVTVYTPGFRRTEWMTLGMSRVSDRGQAVETDARNRAVGIHPSSGRPYRDDVIHEFAHAIDHADDMRFSREIKIVLQDAWADLRSHGLIDESDVEWFQRLLRAAFTDETKSTLDPVEAIAVGFADVEINGPVIGSPQWVIHHFVTTGSPPEITPELVVDLPAVQSDSGSSTPADQPGSGRDGVIGSRPPDNAAAGPRFDPIGARPARADLVYRRYRRQLGQEYRDLAEQLSAVAGEPLSTTLRPELPTVLDHAIDLGGDREVAADTDRLVRLAWRLNCLDELSGRRWADARRLSATGNVAPTPGTAAHRLESLTAELTGYLAAPTAIGAAGLAGRVRPHEAEIATLTRQLDNELAQLFGPPPGLLGAEFPHGVSVADIEGLDAASTLRAQPSDTAVLVRHVDATGVPRFLVVKEPPGENGRPSEWRSPDAAEAVALNVRAKGAVTFTDAGVAVMEASTRFAAGIGAGRIIDARWLTTDELDFEADEGRVHLAFANVFESEWGPYEEVPPPTDVAGVIARSASRLSLSTDVSERLLRQVAGRPATEHDDIVAFFDQLVEWVEAMKMVEASGTVGDGELFDLQHRHKLCMALSTHPDLLQAISTPTGYDTLLDTVHTDGWSIAGIGARVGFLARAEIREALQKVYANNRDFAPYISESLGQPAVVDLDRFGRELRRISEIPARVLDRILLEIISQYVGKSSEFGVPPAGDMRSMTMAAKYRVWKYLAALDDHSPDAIRKFLAQAYLRSGRIGEFATDVFGVAFTGQELRDVEDLYIDRTSGFAFVRYVQLVAGLSPSHRPPTIRAALELMTDVTAEFAQNVRALMGDGEHGRGQERAVLGLQNTGAAALPELKAVVRAMVDEVHSGHLSHDTLVKIRKSDVLASVLMGVTHYSLSTWGPRGIGSLRRLLRYYDQAETDGRIPAMPEAYRPSGVIEIRRLRSRSGSKWTEDLLTRFARLAGNLRAAHSAIAGVRRPITHLLGELGQGIVEHMATLERSLASGTLANGDPMNEVARRKMGERVQELRKLVASEPGSANPFPALRSLKDFEKNFQRLAAIGELHDHLRTICFAWAMQQHPEWKERLQNIGTGAPTLEEISLVREFVDHITNQEVFSHYFSDRKGARTFRRMTSAIALEEAISRAQGVGVARETTPLRFIPTRGPLLELSGHIASVCWAGSYPSLAETMPNMTAVIMVRNPDDSDRARLVGAALLIETTSPSGAPLLLVRGLNPVETYINHVSADDFYQKFTDWAHGVAAARGRRLAIVIDDYVGGAATNRPALFQYLEQARPSLTPIQVRAADTTFNGYNVSQTAYLVGPADAAEQEQQAGLDDRIGSRPPENPAPGSRRDMIGARPVEAGTVYRRYRDRIGKHYRDLATRLGVVAGERWSRAIRPAVLNGAVDVGGDRDVRDDADRLLRLAWRLACFDELAGRVSAETWNLGIVDAEEDQEFEGAYADRPMPSRRLESLTTELAAQEDALATTVAGDDRARYHQAEIARLAGQLDNELAGLLGSPPGSLEAGFPDGAAITDIDGLGGWNVPRDLAPDVRVLVRHVDVTGVARFLVVADSTGADNPSNRWRPPDVAETVALNVRGASAARLDDSGLVVVDTPVRFAAAIGAGRIMDARWLTANELSVEKVEGRLHPSSADTVDYVSDVYGGMFSPIGTAEEIAQSTSRLMSSTDAVETLVQRFSARPAREHAKIATFLDQLAKWSEEFEMSVEAFAAIGASDRLDDRARRQQICIALATHPDLMGVISSSMAYEVLIGIMHIPGWTPAGAGALVEFLARSEIRDAVRKISRTDRHLYSFARGILKCPIVEDFNRVGRELSRVAEIPAGVLEHSLAAKIRQYAMPISESDTSAVHLDFNSALNDVARQSSVALTDYRAWNFLAALEDYSPESIRNKLASEYLRSGRIDEITKDVFGAVVFTERQLQEVEDVYIERASRSAFGVYFRAVAALAPKRRPPIIGAALELVREVTPELARSLRAIMADGRQDGERDLLGLRGAGAAVLPELKVVVRALLSEVNSGDLSHQSLTKVQSSNFVASILMGVTRYSESEWGAGDIASLRQLLDYNQRANADGHIAAMPDVYRPSGVVEVAKLRTRSDPQWTEDLLNRFARLASNLRDAHSAMTRVRRPITQLLGELGRGIVEHVASLERSLASGRLSDGSPVNAVARRKVAALARELRTLVASDSAPVNQFPALRSLKDFENNFELLSGVKELHDHLRTVCFAWAMQKHPEWINRLRDIGVENPSLEEVVLVREFVDHITNQEVFSHYFSDRKGARAFRRMTSAIALEEAIFRTQGVGVANDSTRLQFIPTRGPLLELSGHIASACWAGNYHSVAEAMPNMTAAIMVQNPDDPDHARLAGAGLLIETTSRSGIPVLLIRGLNPQESFINHVSVGDFYRTFTDWARGLAAARGRHLAIVIDEIAGRAATNRPALFGYLADVSRYLTPIEVDMANTTFNGYDVSRRVFLVGPAAAADHQRRTQSDDRIGSRPPTEPGASGDVLQSLTTPESVLGWVRSGVRAGDNGNSDRQALIDHLRERAVFAHPDTGYRSPDGGLSDNRDMRRDHAAKAREIADRLATDPAYGPADAHHDARLHASEMREEYGGFRWQLAVSNVDVSNPAALAAAVAARLPEEDSKPAHKDIVDAAARLAELARPVAGEDAVFVVTSSGDTDGRHRLLARLDYDRPDSTNPDPGVTADELRRGLSDVDGRIDLDTAEPTPEGHVRHSIRLDLTRQRILVCCGLWGQGRTGMSTVNLALCEGLAAAGHDVTVLPDKVAPGFRVPGVQVYAPSERTRYRNAEYLESLPKSVDMVVVHSEANGIEAALNAEKLYPTAKLVAIYHLLPMLWATVQGEQARGRGRLAAGIYLARRAHLVTGLGPALAADAMSQAAMAEHGSVHELRPVLDMAEQPSQPSPGSPVRILMFGRLSDRLKGDAEMAQVVRQLRAQGRDVRLVVRGYDQDLAGTKARLAQIVGDPDAIEVKPHTSDRGEIRADIRAATVVVMPSRAEGFGGVATEAIEQGVPVLVPSTSGVGQFLAALAGYLDTAKQFNLVTQAQGAPVPIDEWLAGLGDVLDDVPGAWAAARRLQELLRPLTRENSARMLVHATVNTEPRSRPETRPSRTLVSRVARQVVARGEEEDYLRILAVVDAMETDPAVRSAIIGRAGIEFAPSPGALPIRLAAADPDEWLFVPSTRTDVDQDDSRGRILGAMVATVSERGFAAATVDEVSRRAGVTPDDFHEKFSRTYDAFAAARQLALENLRQLVVEEVGALRAPDRASRMTTVVNTYVNAVAARPATARAVLIEASGLDLPERASCAMTVTNSIAITLGEVLEPAMSVQVRRALSAAVNARLAEWAATGDVAAVPGLQRDLADLLRIGTASPVLKPTADGVRPPPGADDGVAAEQAKPDEQERILTQLIAVAARHGYAKMSLETVQQWAEVSSRTYRELFTDKATGFEVACAAGIERLRTACRAALSDSVDGDLRARLEMAVRNYLMVLAKHGDETRVLHLELPTDGPLRDRFHSMLAEHLIDAVDEIDARTGGLLASAVTGIVADKIAARQYARFRDLPSSELNAAAMTSLPGDAPIMAAWAHALLTGAELPSSPPPDAPNPPETTKPASRSPWTGKRAGPTPWG